ncbi:MAG: hypothetical protein MZV64_26940 [Ignavibacteriales bacterium]|nr:hypothetical protein [Ignavibacteriales bacterium]
MEIKFVSCDKEFLNLKNDWNRLSKGLTGVNGFDWQYNWWQHNKENNTLSVIVCQKNNKIKGIAPLYIKNVKFLKIFNMKKLAFIGESLAPYFDFLIEQDEDRETVFNELKNYATNNLKYDAIVLKDINSSYPNFDLWQKYTGLLKLSFTKTFDCPYISLKEHSTFQDYFSTVSLNQEKKIKRYNNRLKEQYSNVEYVFNYEITDKDIEIISNMNIKRQKHLTEKGLSGRFSIFHR